MGRVVGRELVRTDHPVRILDVELQKVQESFTTDVAE